MRIEFKRQESEPESKPEGVYLRKGARFSARPLLSLRADPDILLDMLCLLSTRSVSATK